MADEAVLKRIEEQMRRGNELMAEMRMAYGEQLALTRTVIQRNADAFAGLMTAIDRFGDRIDTFGDRIDTFGDRIDTFGDRINTFGDRIAEFGATLDLQREILLRFLDRLDEKDPPQG